MRRPVVLLAAGIAAFLLFLVAFLPASVLLRFVPPQVALTGVTGTIWRGSAAAVAVRGKPLGSLRWSNRPWRLAALELDYGVELGLQGGGLDMEVTLGDSGHLQISNLKGSFPLAAVDGIFSPAGWKGSADIDVRRLVLESGFPRTAAGTVVVRNLTAPGAGGVNIGGFELTLGEGTVGSSDAISGRLRDLGNGPMRVRATLDLKADHSYLLSGDVTAGPEAGPAVQSTLAFLGPPDSLGRRQFSVEGTL